MWWDVSGMSIIIPSSLQFGNSPLMWACGNNRAAVVNILIAHGADVNFQNKVSSTSPAQSPLVTCILM